MKYIHNQKGYGLLIVLLTIVVVGLLSIPLINNALSSAVQVQTSERQVKAQELRDYGQKYFRQLFAVTVEETMVVQDEEGNINLQPEELADVLKDNLRDPIELNNLEVREEADASVSLTIESVEGFSEEESYIEIVYTSNGTFENRSQEMTELLRLDFTDTPSDGSEEGEIINGVFGLAEKIANREEDESIIEGERRYDESIAIPSDVYFSTQLSVRNGGVFLEAERDVLAFGGIDVGRGSQMTINGNFYHQGREGNSAGDDLWTNPSDDSLILIQRDVLVENFSIFHRAHICARGSVFQLSNGEITKVEDHASIHRLDTANGESCDNPDTWEEGVINYEDQNFTEQESGTNPGEAAPVTAQGGWRISSITME